MKIELFDVGILFISMSMLTFPIFLGSNISSMLISLGFFIVGLLTMVALSFNIMSGVCILAGIIGGLIYFFDITFNLYGLLIPIVLFVLGIILIELFDNITIIIGKCEEYSKVKK